MGASISNVTRFRVAIAAATVLAALAIPAVVTADCGVCNLKLQQRTGQLVVSAKLLSVPPTYERGRALPIRIAITNRGTRPIFVDTRDIVHAFSLHMIGPDTKATMPDYSLPQHRKQIVLPGQTFTFPVVDLLDWHYEMHKPGLYEINLSYDRIDSNVVRFRIF